MKKLNELYEYAVRSQSSGIMIPVDELGELIQQNKQLIEALEKTEYNFRIIHHKIGTEAFSPLRDQEVCNLTAQFGREVLQSIQGGTQDGTSKNND